MAKELNATCAICGKKYHLCEICDKNKNNWHSWRLVTDNITCYKLFTILSSYSAGSKTKEEVREFLSTIDLSELETYAEIPKKQIKEILELDNKDNIEKKIVEEIDAVEYVVKDKKENATVKAKKIVVNKQ